MSAIKLALYNLCMACVKIRMQAAQNAFNDAMQASNDDTKSSAGDKYETGRAMMQQEKDRNIIQLNEANKLLVALNRISSAAKSTKAETGSLVITDNGRFYLTISAGALVVDGKKYFAISPASPVGLMLTGKKAGDNFELNGKVYNVLEVI